MFAPNTLLFGKTAFKGAVILAAVEIAAYEISPEKFSTIAVGLGALTVGAAAIISMVLNNRSNRKTREQADRIANDTATAILVASEKSDKILHATQEISLNLDGRLTALLENTKAVATADGDKKGYERAHQEMSDAKVVETRRDEKVITKVADAVVERIGEAADAAANTIPAEKK